MYRTYENNTLNLYYSNWNHQCVCVCLWIRLQEFTPSRHGAFKLIEGDPYAKLICGNVATHQSDSNKMDVEVCIKMHFYSTFGCRISSNLNLYLDQLDSTGDRKRMCCISGHYYWTSWKLVQRWWFAHQRVLWGWRSAGGFYFEYFGNMLCMYRGQIWGI